MHFYRQRHKDILHITMGELPEIAGGSQSSRDRTRRSCGLPSILVDGDGLPFEQTELACEGAKTGNGCPVGGYFPGFLLSAWRLQWTVYI